MKQPRVPNFRRLVIVAVVLIIISTVMVFWARDVIREVVVIPLSYLFWLFGIIVRVTPQIFFWVVLLLLVLMISYRSLVGRKKVNASPPTLVNEKPSDVSNGRALFWATKVNLLRDSSNSYYSNSFHYNVTRLLIDLLSYRYRLPNRNIEDRLKDGSLDIPPQVRDYVVSYTERQDGVYHGFFGELWLSILENMRALWFRLTASHSGNKSKALDPQLAFILNYMEEELEVSHDNDSGR